MAIRQFGSIGYYTSTYSISANTKSGSKFALPWDLLVDTMYFATATNSATVKVKGLIYSNLSGFPDTLLATSDERTGISPGWNALTFSTPIALTGNLFYWLIVFTNTTISGYISTGPDLATSENVYNSDTYSDGPTATFGTVSTSTSDRAIYASGYTEGLDVPKMTAYAVASIGGNGGIAVPKMTAYAVSAAPYSVAKAITYSVIEPKGVQASKLTTYSVLEPRGVQASKLTAYTVVSNESGVKTSKVLAYSAIYTPLQASSITPSTGPLAGGAESIVTGDGFRDSIGATYGSTPAQSVELIDPQHVRLVSPPGVEGHTTITLTQDGETATIDFDYAAPADDIIVMDDAVTDTSAMNFFPADTASAADDTSLSSILPTDALDINSIFDTTARDWISWLYDANDTIVAGDPAWESIPTTYDDEIIEYTSTDDNTPFVHNIWMDSYDDVVSADAIVDYSYTNVLDIISSQVWVVWSSVDISFAITETFTSTDTVFDKKPISEIIHETAALSDTITVGYNEPAVDRLRITETIVHTAHINYTITESGRCLDRMYHFGTNSISLYDTYQSLDTVYDFEPWSDIVLDDLVATDTYIDAISYGNILTDSVTIYDTLDELYDNTDIITDIISCTSWLDYTGVLNHDTIDHTTLSDAIVSNDRTQLVGAHGWAGDIISLLTSGIYKYIINDNFNMGLPDYWRTSTIGVASCTIARGMRLLAGPTPDSKAILTLNIMHSCSDITISSTILSRYGMYPTTTTKYLTIELRSSYQTYLTVKRMYDTAHGYGYRGSMIINGVEVCGGWLQSNVDTGDIRVIHAGSVLYVLVRDDRSMPWRTLMSYGAMPTFIATVSLSTTNGNNVGVVGAIITQFTSSPGAMFGSIPSLTTETTQYQMLAAVPPQPRRGSGSVDLTIFTHDGIYARYADGFKYVRPRYTNLKQDRTIHIGIYNDSPRQSSMWLDGGSDD